MNIHFIGIGGIGMSGLAAICLKHGDCVSGSDNLLNLNVEALIKDGAKVFQGHSKDNISPSTDLVVYTAAIPRSNPIWRRNALRRTPNSRFHAD